MQTISILGGKGRLGNTAARAFHHAGYKVIVISRDANAPRLPEGVEQRAADAMQAAELIKATEGSDFIFNSLNPPYSQWRGKAMQLARNVVVAARQHGAVHLFPGNVYNYGTRIPPVCDEHTPFQADTSMGKIRVEMEQHFEEASRQGIKTIVLRAGDFFGDGSSGAWFDFAILSKLHKNRLVYPGAWDAVHSWAYLPDLAQAFVSLAGQADKLDGYESFLFEGHHLTGNTLYAALTEIVGRPLKKQTVPWWLYRVASLFSPMARAVTEMSYLWFRPHQLDGRRLNAVVGELHTTPLQEALKQSLVATSAFHDHAR
ncbi:NAD-dependent epimerase/dehydratase family protein [Thiothrix nivea]|uniref:NAD-dependent epimerase/dehydratase n=1 Tax=Thiothrix nivea (strain ATCC 35100 / DSM 5205 / JP2) TaxID=870187 RepID=A0A656HEZ1_THINJ|nr:NAD-dependent epimerase/dehydratase family protein [Thiothrix nivea]EIJ34772.1 NAD-dependent epimerase/dehydratase [Thiothrix nivea DSM 5205]